MSDLIFSSIICNGATCTNYEITSPDQTNETSFFTSDQANILHDITLTDVLSSPCQAGFCWSDGSG